jgi:hypothetical protein
MSFDSFCARIATLDFLPSTGEQNLLRVARKPANLDGRAGVALGTYLVQRSFPFPVDEYQASSGKAISCLYVIACVEMQARSRRTIKSASMVRRLSL